MTLRAAALWLDDSGERTRVTPLSSRILWRPLNQARVGGGPGLQMVLAFLWLHLVTRPFPTAGEGEPWALAARAESKGNSFGTK